MKAKVNLTIERDVTEEAREIGINMSQVAEQAIIEAIKLERNRRWVEENRSALDTYAEEVCREGLPLADRRLF